ncbi:MAG TPA: sugar MFS transporter [Bacteroidales bacterium]|nr:sugar MFS transporter [Bacteroidales bacterium]HSA43979.1 sugar MFS transporter [Bacteroidales bacterium]
MTEKRNYIISIGIIGALFFIFGFVTWLNGILIPYLKIACELTNFEALFVAFAFYISYTVMALPSSWVLKKTGFKNGMTLGLIVMAAGTLMFIPAAMTRTYFTFLAGLFVMGTGLAILQTASNPYITIIGPVESAAKRISIMGICNKVAGAIAPLILAFFILSDGDEFVKSLDAMDVMQKQLALDALASRVIVPYLVMTAILVFLGLMIRFSPLPEVELEQDSTEHGASLEGKGSIFGFPHLILGALALFFYVGAEVIAGDTIITYGKSLGIPLATARAFTTYTLIAMVVGYALGIILIPRIISQRRALVYSALLGMLLSVMVLAVPGKTSVIFIALLGLANALVWPAIWPLAIHQLGRFIKTGSAILIMAIAGGALLPLLWGKIADLYSPQTAYMILLPCYLMILLYATWWYRLKSWRNQA